MSTEGGSEVTHFQGYVASMFVVAAGIGLSLFGWMCGQDAAVQLGGMLIGTGLGWIGLKRPADQ